jgi:predicted TIM-barrel fold metal-dependent hydrolase
MAGHPEDLAHLATLLARHENLWLDTSATKWVAREVSRQGPAAGRRFFREWGGRVLFGSDLVVDEHYNYAHYASRYWVQQVMWESSYAGPSPIADPDSAGPVRLRGLHLPDRTLRAIRHDNAARFIHALGR